MVFCSIVLKVKMIHKIVISSCFAAYKITNWSWHRCCATVSRWVTAFPFSRSVSLKTEFSSILSALTSHLKGLPLGWFRNSWFLASVRFSIQRPFAPWVPVPSRPQRRDWLRGLRYSLAFWLRHTGVLSSFFCPPGTSALPQEDQRPC